MVWQDIGITIIQWSFFFALLPTIWSAHKPPLFTSMFTGSLILALAVIFATLHLWSSAASSLLVGGAWFVVGAQTLRAHKRARDSSASESSRTKL